MASVEVFDDEFFETEFFDKSVSFSGGADPDMPGPHTLYMRQAPGTEAFCANSAHLWPGA
jgi:hypothetical protein